MAVQYTIELNFPLLDDGGKSWGAVANGVYTDLDTYLTNMEVNAFDILTHNNDVLVHDGDVLRVPSL